MAKALDLAAALTGHALAAFGLMGADPDLEAARYCLAWLCRERPEHFTTRDAPPGVEGPLSPAEQVRAALAVLEERGFLVAAPSARDSGPGRPASPAYLVNPACGRCGNGLAGHLGPGLGAPARGAGGRHGAAPLPEHEATPGSQLDLGPPWTKWTVWTKPRRHRLGRGILSI